VSEALRAQAEIARLSRLLRRDPATLSYLQSLPSADLRRLREQVTEALYDTGAGALERLAAASRLLPVGLVANLSERVFGPVLSARIAGLIEPGRAGQIAGRLPTAFLADVAVELDPRRAQRVLAAIAPARIAEVTVELVRRGEHVAMASFVDYLPAEALRAATAAVDGAQLLSVALLVEGGGRIEEILQTLSPRQLEQLAQAAQREDQWAALLPLTRLMAPATLERFAALPTIQRPQTLERIVAAAAEDPAVWSGLVPVAASLPEEGRSSVIDRVRALGPDRFAQFQQRARELGLLERLGLQAPSR